MTTYFYENTSSHALSGKDYRLFLQTCAQFCAYFSFSIHAAHSDAPQTDDRWQAFLAPYQVSGPSQSETADWAAPADLRLWFSCTPDAVQALQEFEGSIFGLMDICGGNNPFDIAFERADGTVFADCHADDGLCWIMPEEGEDISPLLQNRHWTQATEGSAPL